MNNELNQTNPSLRNGKLAAGGVLILIGIFLFVANYINLEGWMFFGAIGLIFLVWGVLSASFGLIIPGGIVIGVAAGIYLVEGPFALVSDPAKGGLFLLGLAAGWLLVSLFSPLSRSGWQAWPLIPGSIIAAVGGALMAGEPGLQVLEYFGQGWPLILIALGIYLVLRRN